jgi:hypothetical protein
VSAAALALLMACQPHGVGDADARAALALACASRSVARVEVVKPVSAPTFAGQPQVVSPAYRQPVYAPVPMYFGGGACGPGG